jgi:hypothetical protein
LFFLSQYHYSLGHSIFLFLFVFCFFKYLKYKNKNNIYLPNAPPQIDGDPRLSAGHVFMTFDFSCSRRVRLQHPFQTDSCDSCSTHCRYLHRWSHSHCVVADKQTRFCRQARSRNRNTSQT